MFSRSCARRRRVALPTGSTVTPISLTGPSDLYEFAVDYFDTMIRSSILLQTLAVAEGKHQARAASQTHANLLADLVQVLKDFVGEALYTDVVRVLVRFNYGEDAAFRLSPRVSLGDPNKRDFESAATAFGSLGYSVDETQFPAIDAMLGVPVRDPEEVRLNRLAELEMKMSAANALPVDYAPEQGTPGVPNDGNDLAETKTAKTEK
jgi:phage gp29-like protein